jgi:hypothetical protein
MTSSIRELAFIPERPVRRAVVEAMGSFPSKVELA